jgi:hypothetical protein
MDYLKLDADLADGADDDANVVDDDHHVPQIAKVQSITQSQRTSKYNGEIIGGGLQLGNFIHLP